MKRNPNHARKGTTLIEVALASSLLVVVGSTAILAARSTTQAYRAETTIAELERVGRQAMAEVEAGLRAANAGAVVPAALEAPFSSTSVEFFRCTGFGVGGIQWGPPERLAFEQDPLDPDDGVDDDGDGTIDEGGFSVVFEGGLATVRLTLVRRDQAGFLVEHEMARTVALRNTGNTEVTP